MFLSIYKHPHQRHTVVNCNLFIEFLQDMHNWLEVTVISKQVLCYYILSPNAVRSIYLVFEVLLSLLKSFVDRMTYVTPLKTC